MDSNARICPNCEQEFQRTRTRQMYCSRRCTAQAAARRRFSARPQVAPGHKVCRECGEELPVERFPRHAGALDGRGNTCYTCRDGRAIARYADGPVLVRERKVCRHCKQSLPATLEYFGPQQRNRDWLEGVCRECRRQEQMRRYRANVGNVQEKQRAYAREYRLQVLRHYGGDPPRCACCGESRLEFLSIDHVNGDGAAHRRQINEGGRTLIGWIRQHNYPDGFAVLCMNCNFARGHSRDGLCPHERERRAAGDRVESPLLR